MSESTERLALPLLQAAQAQKEVTHNEALARLDRWVHPVAESRTLPSPPASPAAGKLWIVPAGAGGDWAGQEGMIAEWNGAWAFRPPPPGFLPFVADEAVFIAAGVPGADGGMPVTALRIGGRTMLAGAAPSIADPAGGATVDSEARAVIALLISALEDHGLLSA